MPPLIFRKGLDLKHEVAHVLAESYHSDLVRAIKDDGYRRVSGRVTIHLAREFGFCYGVDRAVDYAYQTRKRFPDQRVFLTGEIIHNPHVNDQLRAQAIRFLTDPGESLDALTPDDVVILPAFGITIDLLQDLTNRGCTLVDTTCGSVLNVWKNVKRYADEGFTSIIHGKYWHEETRATASQALRSGTGHYLVVLNQEEAAVACDYIRHGGDRAAFMARFEHAVSPGFDPDTHLVKVGCANQTTMLSTESLEIGELFRGAYRDRYGDAALAAHFRAFDTICSATQDRQDAVTRAAGRAGAGRDDRRRRLQQQQYLQPGTDLRRSAADLPHRRPRRHRVGRRDPPQARRPQAGSHHRRLAAGRPAAHRPDVRGLDARQPGWHGDSPPRGRREPVARAPFPLPTSHFLLLHVPPLPPFRSAYGVLPYVFAPIAVNAAKGGGVLSESHL